MARDLKYAYIVSTSYSGSTLLCMLLNAHPQLASIGELSNMIGQYFKIGRHQEYLCSCGVEIESCAFWKKVQERCREKGVELDLHDFGTDLDAGLGNYIDADLNVGLGYYINRFFFRGPGKHPLLSAWRDRLLSFLPPYRRIIKKVIHRKVMIAQAVLEETGKTVFLDGSKGLAQAALLNKNEKLDFKLIHLVRDPRGFVNSFCKRWSDQEDGTDQCCIKAAHEWMETNEAVLRTIRPNMPDDSYLLVHYEKLCQHTDETLAEICRFLELPRAELISLVNERPHHLIGNQMRLRKFQGISLDQSWRERLTPQQLSLCARMTGEVSKELGYDLIAS